MCKHLSDRITQDQQTARAVAPSLPDTLADCAPQPAHSRRRFSVVERSAAPTARANMCATIGVTGYPRYASCLRGRAIAPRHSRRLCAAAGSLPPPLLGGRTIGRADHLRHFRASLPTQEPHPHGGPFFSCWATPSAPATGASTKCNHISGRLYSPPVGVPNHLLLCHVGGGQGIRGFATAAASDYTDLRQPRRLHDRPRVPRLLMC